MEEYEPNAAAFSNLFSTASPHGKLQSRRASLATPCERRMSAVCQPESHPVSPAGSDENSGEGGSGECGSPAAGRPSSRGSGSARKRQQRSPTSPPATSHFSIPAIRFGAGSLTPAAAAPLPPVAEERVVLNLFVGEGTPTPSTVARRTSNAAAAGAAAAAADELASLRQELDVLRAAQQDDAGRVTLVLNVVEAPAAAPTADSAAQAAAATADAAAQAAATVAERGAQTEAPALADAAAQTATAGPVGIAEAAAQTAAGGAAAEVVQLVIQVVEHSSAAGAEHGFSVAAAACEEQRAGSPARDAADAAASHAAGPAALQQQLARAEACRDELSRQAGQLKGRIAKLEGAVQAGESRVKAQAGELEALKAANRELESALAAAEAQVGVTPERARAERQRLAEAAAAAQAAADAHSAAAQRLAAVLAFEEKERSALAEFAALEHELLAEAEAGAAAEAAQWRANAGAAAGQLAEVRRRLVDTDAALLARDEEVRQLSGELQAAQAATEAANQLAGEWRQRCDQFDRDRQAAAANIRKAERELEMVAADNERMFRQLNYVRTRLIQQLGGLDASVPDIGKLARELQSWCDREAAQRVRNSKA